MNLGTAFYVENNPHHGLKWRMKSWNLDTLFENTANTALIILNQPLPGNLVTELWPKCKIKICADGGANRLRQLNLSPDMIVGDLDSIHHTSKSYYSDVELIYIDDQDTNDFEKCIQKIMHDQDIDLIMAIGALGGRFDHQMANISALYKYSKLKIYLISNESIVFLLDAGKHVINSVVNERFKANCGLLPIGGKAIVKTTGLKWDLDASMDFSFGNIVSTSNRFNADCVTVDTNEAIIFTQELDLN